MNFGPRGVMSIRLETHYDHLPQSPPIKEPKFALNRCDGVEMRASISYCATCNVNLCIYCYKMFHQNASITQSKKSLVNQFTNFFTTHTLSNPYCKLTIYAIFSFIISFEIWDVGADVAIVRVFHLYFTSIFSISLVLR